METLIEGVKVVQAYPSTQWLLADTRYNGSLSGGSPLGIDTRDYDEATIVMSFGSIHTGTLDVTVIDSSVGTSVTGAAAITSATFAQKTTATAAGLYIGTIKTKLTQRYLYVKAIAASANPKDYAVMVILSKTENLRPLSQTIAAEFSV